MFKQIRNLSFCIREGRSRRFSTTSNAPKTKRLNRRGIDWDLQRKEFKLCLLGRPNVGKSTLFNTLVKRNSAIVSNIAGTTRDRREGLGQLGELRFRIMDTGGLEELNKGPSSSFDFNNTGLLPSMMAQVEYAMDEADVGLFVLDAKQGVTKDDEFFVRWIRKRQVTEGRKLPIHLIANKSESLGHGFEWGNSDLRWEQFMVDCFRLGFGDPIPMAAEHKQGLGDLYSVLEPYGLLSIEEATKRKTEEIVVTAPVSTVETGSPGSEVDLSGPIKIALVGRTNVGKSTLFNTLIGSKRVITGPLAGLTRDAIQVEWKYKDTDIHLIDTAGMQKRSKLYLSAKGGGKQFEDLPGKVEQSTLEGLSVDKSMHALEMAQIVVVVVELDTVVDDKGREALSLRSHDLVIMSRIMAEGRGMIIAVNKSDLIVPEEFNDAAKASHFIRDQVEQQIEDAVPLARGVPIVPLSALHGDNVGALMPQVLDVYKRWNTKIPTNKLNDFVIEAQANRSAPQKPMNVRSRRIGENAKPRLAPVKIKFMNQMYTRPPHFALFTNRLQGEGSLPPSYISYLTNRLRTKFNLDGIPIRFTVKGSKNPYAQSNRRVKQVSGDAPSPRTSISGYQRPKRGLGRKLQRAEHKKRFKASHRTGN